MSLDSASVTLGEQEDISWDSDSLMSSSSKPEVGFTGSEHFFFFFVRQWRPTFPLLLEEPQGYKIGHVMSPNSSAPISLGRLLSFGIDVQQKVGPFLWVVVIAYSLLGPRISFTAGAY